MTEKKEDPSAADDYNERLKGTFITVLGIGAFILLFWLGMFYYYITTV